MSQKITRLFLLLALLLPLALVACSGATEDVQEQVDDAVAQVEEVAGEGAVATAEAAAAEVAAAAEAAAAEAEEAAAAAAAEAEEAAAAAAAEAEEAAAAAAAEAEEAVEEVMEEDPCAPATEGPLAGVDMSAQTVVWWHNHSGSREELLLEIVAEYNETNPCGITIEAINQGSYNDIRDAVNASIASGEVPAALVVGYQNDQAFYQLNDTLVDLNTFLNDPKWGLTEEEQAEYYQSFFNQSIHVAFDNQRLGFPPNRSLELLHYNKTYLEELGYTAPPATPEEFVEMSCAAAAASPTGVGGYILREDASAMAAWTYAFGGDVLTEDGTTYVYNSDATIQAMQMLQELATEGEDGQICAYFFDGFPNPEVASRNALFSMGSSSGIPFYMGDFATVAEEAGREPDEYAVAAIPHTTADPVMNIYGGDVMIVKTTPEQELAAWDFVKWFTSAETQAAWTMASNYFPTHSGATPLLEDYVAGMPPFGTALELLNYGKFEPQLISYQSVRDAAEEAFNQIMQGADVVETLNNLTELANELQAELEAEME
jgi:ABC-type glycerol-3-phosphate transport system substrate-binding protein